jgi:hypothetical protein
LLRPVIEIWLDDMAEILPFKRPKASERHRGKTLCRNGHHKWQIDKQQVFDVKSGRLVNRYRCQRCGIYRVRTD